MSWFTTGMEKVKEEVKRREESGNREFDRHSIFRFYIPAKADSLNKDHRLIFLDEVGFVVYMHHYELNGRWGNWAACPKETGVSTWCPLCERPKTWATQVTHYTVLDATGWTDKDGKERYQLRILPASPKYALKLDDRRERHGTLIGADFTVRRTTKNADNCGDDIIYEGRVNLEEFCRDNIGKMKASLDFLPEDYGFWSGEGDARKYHLNHGLPWEKVLHPLTAEELQEKLTGRSSSSSSGSSTSNSNVSY